MDGLQSILIEGGVASEPASLWKHPLVFPAYLAALSMSFLFLHKVWGLAKPRILYREESDDAPNPHPGAPSTVSNRHSDTKSPQNVIVLLRLLRLLSCTAFLILSSIMFFAQPERVPETENGLAHNRSDETHPTGCILEIIFIAFYAYASLLSLCTLALSIRNRKRAQLHLDVVLLSVLLVYTYRDLYPLCTYTESPADAGEGRVLWIRIGVLVFAAVILPLITPREYIPIDPLNSAAPTSEQTASPLSFMLFLFVDRLVYLGWKHPHLPYDQLPDLCDYDRGAYLRKLGHQHILVTQGKKRIHLGLRIIELFYKNYAWMAITTSLNAMIGFLAPLSVNRLLAYIETDGKDALIRPWVWVALFFLTPLLSTILAQLYGIFATHVFLHTQALLTQLIFEHALLIRVKNSPPSTNSDSAATNADTATRKKAPGRSNSNIEGRLNNLISSDLQAIGMVRDLFQLLAQSPLRIGLCMWFLYAILGWSALVGMGIIVVGMIPPGIIARYTHTVQVAQSRATDERVQLVTETLGVIRLIKMFGYEARSGAQIAEKRERELGWYKKSYFLRLLSSLYNWILPLTTMVATFFTYTVVMKQPLSSSKVFSSLTVFDTLRQELSLVNYFLPRLIQGKVSLDRVDDFLANSELLDRYTNDGTDGPLTDLANGALAHDHIGFKDAVFAWDQEHSDIPYPTTPSTSTSSTLRKFRLRVPGNLFFKRGALNLILGPTGSGKTSILLALLGELHFIPSGLDSWYNLPRDGGIAYAAQSPWILNRTVRENITFQEPFDTERYEQVLAQCALKRDLELFDAGDRTEVGEKGLTLSGGQKARISLARAVYSKAAIVLLDDVLSALDVHTARSIVNDCLAGPLLGGRTVILVTHNTAITAAHARNFVRIGSDGIISHSETIDDMGIALVKNPKMKDEEETHSSDIVNPRPTDQDKPIVRDLSGKLIVAEEIALGRVTWRAVMLYISNVGSTVYWVALLACMLAVEAVNVLLSWWLGVWSRQYQLTSDPSSVPVYFYLGYYILLVALGMSVLTMGYMLYRSGVIKASKRIHELLVTSVLHTTLRVLDTTPLGRLISRFTQDIRAVDVDLAGSTSLLTANTASLLLKLGAIVVFTPAYVFPGTVLAIVAYAVGRVYMAAQLSVKREMSNARSPVFGHLEAAISGLISIRAYGAETAFKERSLALIDGYTRPARAFYNLNRWITVRIDTIGGIFSGGLAGYLLYGVKAMNSANIGLQLNLAVGFSSILIVWIRLMNDAEVSGNSLERLQSYIDIEHEESPSGEGKPPAAWPTSGQLVVENLSARYYEGGPEVLHRMSFQIPSGSKIGVVGRTGSGKSSLALSLLRLIPTEGDVVFDGRSTHQVNLEEVRRAITIIPQHPELLAGTIRQNLDPYGSYDDAILNDALRSAGLFSLQADLDEADRITLDSAVSSAGGNFSLGQRQIVALARALVRRSKLLILDEATASLDHQTDSLIQRTLNNEFRDVTLITVAHRLQTVMSADKIMVLDAGHLAEFDSPVNLLQQKSSIFKSLVDGSGDKDDLYRLASVRVL